MTERRAPAWLTQWTYAHRGLHSDGVPENSLAAAEAAIAAGMGIECDTQLTLDEHPMVFHDWQLDRLTGREGEVADRNSEDVAQLPLAQTAQTPQRLKRFLEYVDSRVPVLIEIKSKPGYDVERSCREVEVDLEGYNGPHAVMSFDPRVGHWFAEHSPDRIRGLVCTDTLDYGWLSQWRKPGAMSQADPDFLAMDIRDLPNSICSLWRETGRPLLSWTIRSAELREKAEGLVDAPIAEGEGV